MIPLVPTIALALVSTLCSMFVIVRILLPILPPSPLSRRVPPSEFGLPNYGKLSAADKSHLYFVAADLFALGMFIWQVVAEHTGSSTSHAVALDTAGSVRFWFACTARQTTLAVIFTLAIVQIRKARSVSLGPVHSWLVLPTVLILTLSSVVAATFARFRVPTLFIGTAVFGVCVAAVTTLSFVMLARTIVAIRRNMAGFDEANTTWPPMKEKKRRGSFATEDVEALKEGSSWITSHRSSRGNSVSSFAFSTNSALPSSHNSSTRNKNFAASSNSVVPKSSYWFSAPASKDNAAVPPVPPLPEEYQFHPPSPTSSVNDDHDPFRREKPIRPSRLPKSSQNSWLTSPSVSQATLSEFSFPATRPGTPRGPATSTRDLLPASATTLAFTPALAPHRVLGGYGYLPPSSLEKGDSAVPSLAPHDAPVSALRIVGWLSIVWLPIILSAPYLLYTATHSQSIPLPISALLTLSVTVSSPLLCVSLLLSSPAPIPNSLFPSRERNRSTPFLLPPTPTFSGPYSVGSRATTPTVIEGRRSGDIWIQRGDAVDGRSRVGRAVGMMHPVPKLSVLPPEDPVESRPSTPPLPMQTREISMSLDASEGSGLFIDKFASLKSFASRKTEAKLTSEPASIKHASRIMVAARHTSALATTLTIQPATLITEQKRTSIAHSRSQSASSVTRRFPVSPSPPPSAPLPPTPLKTPHGHVRAKSSSEYSFSPIANAAQIDGLSAGMLPLLVPGLKVGQTASVRQEWEGGVAGPKSKPLRRIEKHIGEKKPLAEQARFKGASTSFSSPELHSTPPVRPRRTSKSRSHHYSLPSFGLVKGITADFMLEVETAFRASAGTPPEDSRRKTLCGGEFVATSKSRTRSQAPSETPGDYVTAYDTLHKRNLSTGSLGRDARRSSSPIFPPPEQPSSTDDPFLTPKSADFPDDISKVPTPNLRRTVQPSSASHRPQGFHLPTTSSRPSSITYIKSPPDTAPPPVPENVASAKPAVPWVPLLRSSPTYLKRTGSDGSDKLRPLLLLKERDMNTVPPENPTPKKEVSLPSTRPLSIKSKRSDENSSPSLKTLRLVRTATAKARAKWMETAPLPSVMVRPPSTASTIIEPRRVGYAI